MDGENLMFNTWHDTVKATNIKRDGRVAICVDDDVPPFSYVIIEGKAEILEPTSDELLHWATVIGGRLYGRRPGRGIWQAEWRARRTAYPSRTRQSHLPREHFRLMPHIGLNAHLLSSQAGYRSAGIHGYIYTHPGTPRR